MTERKKNKPIELECRPDVKNKKRLICEKTKAAEKGNGLVKTTENGIVEAEENVVSKERPNVIIGAINIGAQPIREFFRSRWERFYHQNKHGHHWHIFLDLFFVAAIVFLAALNIFLFFKDKEGTVPLVEFKAVIESAELRLGEPVTLRLSYINSEDYKLRQAKFILQFLNGFKVISVKGGAWDAAARTIVIGDIPSFDAGKTEIVLESRKFGKSEILVLFEYLDKKGQKHEDYQRLVLGTPAPELKFTGYGRYFSPEGEQLGRGPLPPQVGKTTKYQVFWLVERTVVDLEDVIVEAQLVDNVKWTGFTPLGGESLYFDFLTRKITWQAGKVQSNLNLTQETRGAVGAIFEIAFTPDASQTGKKAILIRDIKIRGKDAVSGAVLKNEAPDITTNLVFDSKAAGKRKVMP